MGSVGDCYDNALCEAFSPRWSAIATVLARMEVLEGTTRIVGTPPSLSPVNYERRQQRTP